MCAQKRRSLKAILFDIDDTLFSTTTLAQKARRNAIQAMQAHGLQGNFDVLFKDLQEVIQEFSTNYEHHFDKLLQRVPQHAIKGVNPAILIAAGMVAYHDTKFKELKVYDDAQEVLQQIHKETNLRLGIITSGVTIKQAEKIVRLGIYPYLDPTAIFISDQIGINKPNIKIYQKACASMELEPQEIMYIGDNPQNDITPPQQLGMLTCWHRRSGKYQLAKGAPQPDYKIQNFHDLREILIKDFDCNL